MKKKFLLILTTYFIFFNTSYAYAYLDPGSATLILQGILAFIAGLVVTIKMWFYHVLNFLNIIKKKLKKKKNID
tara:strand:+ start:136 stop:357 length:222 start_codon:yes stop_codon:yes gene_type:complete